MKNPSRRTAIKTTLLGTTAALFSNKSSEAKSAPTPPEIEGPFYPVTQQKDKDFDLTLIQGKDTPAKGEIVHISGKILDTAGNPIEDAMIELWQANAAGRYAHPRDTSESPLDPNFQGWSVVPSAKDGSFNFKTIKPGAYKVAEKWTRPPHIHFKATKFGHQPITTQMYFPNEPLNKVDGLLQRKTPAEQLLMIANPTNEKPNHYTYNLILETAGKTNPQQE